MSEPPRILLAPAARTSCAARLLAAAAGERRLELSTDPGRGTARWAVVLLAAGAEAGARAAAARSARLVLDADDPDLRRLGRDCEGAITWCSLDPRNPLLLEHLERGGDGCLVQDGRAWLCAGPSREAVAAVSSAGAHPRRGPSEVLLALGAAVALGLTLADVRAALGAPSPGPA